MGREDVGKFFVGSAVNPGEGICNIVFCFTKPLAIFAYFVGKEMGGMESSDFESYPGLDGVLAFL